MPGPVISLSTLTNENAPLITPNPNPDTKYEKIGCKAGLGSRGIYRGKNLFDTVRDDSAVELHLVFVKNIPLDTSETPLGLAHEQIEEIAERLLNENGEDEREGEVIPERHDGEPDESRGEQRDEPEERARYEQDHSDGIFGHRDHEHGQWRTEGQKQTSKKLNHGHSCFYSVFLSVSLSLYFSLYFLVEFLFSFYLMIF